MSGHVILLHTQKHLPTHVRPLISKGPQSEQSGTQHKGTKFNNKKTLDIWY